jgi:hypothetical protein
MSKPRRSLKKSLATPLAATWRSTSRHRRSRRGRPLQTLLIEHAVAKGRILELLSGVAVVIHNAAFELMQFEVRGVELGMVHCTMRAARLTLGEPLEIGKPLEGCETCGAPSYR